MAIYSELAQVEVSRLLDDFDEQLVSYRLLEGGSANTNYYVATRAGDRLLTIGETITIEDLQLLIDLLLHLEHAGFETSKVLMTQDGNPWTMWHGKPVTLKTFIKGHVTDTMSHKELRMLGQTIARLHGVPSPQFLAKKHRYGLEAYDDLTNIYKLTNDFADWLFAIKAELVSAIPQDLPRCLIHGDLFDNNVVITADKKAVILDFEEACHYYRVFDMGMAIVGCCSKEFPDIDSARILVSTYREHGELTDTELSLLPLFCCYAAACTAFWRYRQFHFLKPSPIDQERYRQMKKLADHFRSLPASSFIS